MKNVSFIQETGYSVSGRNISSVASHHEAGKNHILDFTAYKLLGNVDIACALDEAKQRESQAHYQNASRLFKVMKNHINATVYLSAQGLAFRGHDESNMSSKRGNFLDLFDVLGCYDHDLKMFLDKDHVTYTSHEPQNDLIKSIYEEVHSEIKQRIANSRYISVMMDDTLDKRSVEQSAILVRLIYHGEVEEHLLAVVDCSEDQSADGLTSIMLQTLED